MRMEKVFKKILLLLSLFVIAGCEKHINSKGDVTYRSWQWQDSFQKSINPSNPMFEESFWYKATLNDLQEEKIKGTNFLDVDKKNKTVFMYALQYSNSPALIDSLYNILKKEEESKTNGDFIKAYDIQARDYDNKSGLGYALQYNTNLSVVKKAIEIYRRDVYKDIPFVYYDAILRNPNIKVFTYIFSSTIIPRFTYDEDIHRSNYSLLVKAFQANTNYKIINRIIDDGVDLNKKSAIVRINNKPIGFVSPLSIAVSYVKDHKVIEELINRGADVHGGTDGKKDNKLAPIFFAAKYNTATRVIDTLVRKGASYDIVDSSNRNLLHYSSMGYNGIRMAKFLISKGVMGSDVDRNGLSPLQYAARSSAPSGLTVFLAKNSKADINSQDDDEKTILHYLAAKRDLKYEHVLEMLELGANKIIKDEDGKIPHDIVLENPYVNKKLQDKSTEENFINKDEDLYVKKSPMRLLLP